MGSPGVVFADELHQVNAEAIALARACTDAQWQVKVRGEEWPVGVVLHHIAEGHVNAMGWLESMLRGEAVTDTSEGIDDMNVEHAVRAAAVHQEATARLLEENGARLEMLLRGLSDADLDRVAPFGPAGGAELPVRAFAPVTAGHARQHLAHARTALEASSG
jgi:hypothetical protein